MKKKGEKRVPRSIGNKYSFLNLCFFSFATPNYKTLSREDFHFILFPQTKDIVALKNLRGITNGTYRN